MIALSLLFVFVYVLYIVVYFYSEYYMTSVVQRESDYTGRAIVVHRSLDANIDL